MKSIIKVIRLITVTSIVLTACTKTDSKTASELPPFGLTCGYITTSGSDFGDRTYIIDPINHTVDNHPAEIYDTIIKWEADIGTSKNNQMSIERYTGDFKHSYKGELIASGKCKKLEKII